MKIALIADIWDKFPTGFAMNIFWFVVCMLSLAVLVLTALTLWRNYTARKPTIDEDFRSQQKVLEELKRSLAGLAPNEKVTELVNKLSQFATQDQIRKIELALPEMIKREELERCLEKLQRGITPKNGKKSGKITIPK